jgi:hypothetical protein
MVTRQTTPRVVRAVRVIEGAGETDRQEAAMKNGETPNPWQVLNAVSQRISQGFGVRSSSYSDPTSGRTPQANGSLEEASRRMVEGQLAGADIKPISGWLRHSEYSQLAKLEQEDRLPNRPNTPQ